jgi:hypothetical protein
VIWFSAKYLCGYELVANIRYPSKEYVFDEVPRKHCIGYKRIDETNNLWYSVKDAFVHLCQHVTFVYYCVRLVVDEKPVHKDNYEGKSDRCRVK